MVLFVAVLATHGCAGPRKFQPDLNPDGLDHVQFVHYLASVPVVTVEEGARAMIILADGQDVYSTYDERMTELVRRGVVREAWKLRPANTLDKGTLAYMLFKICRVPGGVDSLLFGSWGLGDRRYALQDISDAGILDPGPDYAPVTGGEMVGALARADGYMADSGAYESAERQIDSPAELGEADTKR